MPRRRCLDSRHVMTFDAQGRLRPADPARPRVVKGADGSLVVNPTQRQLRDLLASGPAQEVVFPAGCHPSTALRHASAVFAGEDPIRWGAFSHSLPERLFSHRGSLEDLIRNPQMCLPSRLRHSLVASHLLSWLDGCSDRETITRIEQFTALLNVLGDSPRYVLALTASDAPVALAAREHLAAAAQLVLATHRSGDVGDDGNRKLGLTEALELTQAAPHSTDVELLRLMAADGLGRDAVEGLTSGSLAAYAVARARGAAPEVAMGIARSVDLRTARRLACGLAPDCSAQYFREWAQHNWSSWLALHLEVSPTTAWRVGREITYSTGGVAAIAGVSPRALVEVRSWATAQAMRGLSGDSLEALASNLAAGLRVAAVMGKRTAQWREKMESMGVSLHDAAFWLPDPGAWSRSDCEDFATWAVAAVDRRAEPGGEMARIRSITAEWRDIPPEQRWVSGQDPAGRLKERAATTQELATWVATASVRLGAGTGLAQVLSRHAVGKRRAERAAEIWSASATEITWLPRGRRIVDGGYMWEFLPRSAGEGLFLGEETDCCQSLGSAGASCAIDGQTSPGSGFLVVRDRSSRIIAQAWVWLSEEGVACFDNVECLGRPEGRRLDAIVASVDEAAAAVSRHVAAVHIGTGMSGVPLDRYPLVAETSGPGTDSSTPQPFRYSGYRDSHTQRLLASSSDRQLSVRPTEGGLRLDLEGASVRMTRDATPSLLLAHLEPAVGEITTQHATAVAQFVRSVGEPATSTDPVLAKALATAGVPSEPIAVSGVDAAQEQVKAARALRETEGVSRAPDYLPDDDEVDFDGEPDFDDFDDWLDDEVGHDTETPAALRRAVDTRIDTGRWPVGVGGVRFRPNTESGAHPVAEELAAAHFDVPDGWVRELGVEPLETARSAQEYGVPRTLALTLVACGVRDLNAILAANEARMSAEDAATAIRCLPSMPPEAAIAICSTPSRIRTVAEVDKLDSSFPVGAVEVERFFTDVDRWRARGFRHKEAVRLALLGSPEAFNGPAARGGNDPRIQAELDADALPPPLVVATADTTRYRPVPLPRSRYRTRRTDARRADGGATTTETPGGFRPVWTDPVEVGPASTSVDQVVAGAVLAGLVEVVKSRDLQLGEVVEAVSYLAPDGAYVRPGTVEPLRSWLRSLPDTAPDEALEQWRAMRLFSHCGDAGLLLGDLLVRAYRASVTPSGGQVTVQTVSR